MEGFWTSIAGVWVLRIATFEWSGFLGKNVCLLNGDPSIYQAQGKSTSFAASFLKAESFSSSIFTTCVKD